MPAKPPAVSVEKRQRPTVGTGIPGYPETWTTVEYPAFVVDLITVNRNTGDIYVLSITPRIPGPGQ
jgi:hypothetical protein